MQGNTRAGPGIRPGALSGRLPPAGRRFNNHPPVTDSAPTPPTILIMEPTRLSVEGATLGDAYDNFKLALQDLQRARVVSPGIAITFRYVVHSASSAVPIARTQ